MTKYLTQSANVLNDADRFEGIMKFNEFANAQEIKLWTGEPGWRPGDPLYPVRNIALSMTRQHIPMIEEVDDNVFHNSNRVRFYLRCEDCLVSWEGDAPCWMCGEDCPIDPLFLSYKSFVHDVPITYNADANTYTIEGPVRFENNQFGELRIEFTDEEWARRVESRSGRSSEDRIGRVVLDDLRSTMELYGYEPPGWSPVQVVQSGYGYVSYSETERQQRAIREMLDGVDLNATPAIEPPVIRRRNDALAAYLARQEEVTTNDLLFPLRRYNI